MKAKTAFNIDNLDPDLVVRFSGYHRCPPGHRYHARRDHFVAHVVFSGKGFFQMAGKTWTLRKGDTFFIFPDMDNNYKADMDDPWSYRFIGFSGMKSADWVRKIGITTTEPVVRLKKLRDLEKLLIKTMNCLQGRRPEYELNATSFLFRFLALCMAVKTKGKKQLKIKDLQDQNIRKVIEFVHLNYQRKISVDQLSRLIGLERTYFSKLFRKHTNMSPLDLILQTRITRAKELLKAGDMRVSDVAYAVGYDEYFTFERRFKKMTGKSPTDFIAGQGKRQNLE